jgi:protein-disulfide isomerase
MRLLRVLQFVLLLFFVACASRPPANPPQRSGAPAAGPLVRSPAPGFEGQIAAPALSEGLPTYEQVDDRYSDLVDGERYRLTYHPRTPVTGSPMPLVTVVMFGDYQCPYSKRLYDTLDQLLREYPNDLRLVYKHFPLDSMHPQAKKAAEAATAAHEQGDFWLMHRRLFDDQRNLSRQDLRVHARTLGLDVGRFEAELNNSQHARAVDQDLEQGRHFGVRSTPSVFINGRSMSGSRPIAELRELIEEERALARRMMDAGAPRPEIYARVMRAASDGPRKDPKPATNARPGRPDPAMAYRVPVDGRPFDGPADALVTVVEFADYQCPFCARVQPTLAKLRAKHPRDVRIVWRNLPLAFHKEAREAAMAALAANKQGKFWQMHAELFANQKQLGPEFYRKAAKRIGLRLKRFQGDLGDPALERMIAADEELAKKLGARGTPAFFVNGRFLSGAQPFEKFDDLVKEERDKALAWRKAHPAVSPGKTYETMSRDFVAAVAPAAAGTGRGGAVTRKPAPIAASTRQNVSMAGLPQRGSQRAAVQIVECADFDCPYCKRVQTTLDQLLKQRRGKVSVHYMHNPLPFHKNARIAHRAAVAAQKQGKFWRMHDLLYAQPKKRSRKEIEAMAKQAGLDLRRFRADLESPDTDARIDRDIATCQALGASGTPTFFVNGRKMVGARSYADFESVTDEELAGGP